MISRRLLGGLCGANQTIFIRQYAYISTTSPRFESPLGMLRRKTGFALNLCKKALSANENDVKRAEKWLQEEAKRNGWQKASQLQSRRASEGLVGVYVNANHRSGVLLEVNCESDFVARNEIFRNLVSQLTLKMASATIVKGEVPSKGESGNILPALKKYPIAGAQLEPFKDSLATAITQLGENIKLTRAMLIENVTVGTDSPIHLLGYAHAVGGQSNSLNGVSIGKYGTVLAFREVAPVKVQQVEESVNNSSTSSEKGTEQSTATEEDPDAFEELEQNSSNLVGDSTSRAQVAKLVCQHIIGLKPTRVSRPEAEAKEEGQVDDSDALLDQKFLVNEQVTVRQLCSERGLNIVDFQRFECGQNLESAN
jgi:elongation factor Ts